MKEIFSRRVVGQNGEILQFLTAQFTKLVATTQEIVTSKAVCFSDAPMDTYSILNSNLNPIVPLLIKLKAVMM